MKDIRKRHLTALLFLSLLFISGCAWHKGYGKISSEHNITIQVLEKNWSDYVVSYAGLSEENAAAIMFDPRNDGKMLQGKAWTRVKDRQAISKIIGWIKNYDRYYPVVWKILGPGNHLFGYVYTPLRHLPMKVVDEHTLYVYDVESPLYFDDGDGFDGIHQSFQGP